MYGLIAPFLFDCFYGTKELEYREPFAGGLGLLDKMLYKLWFHRLCINDLDPGIACIWTSVIRYPEAIAQRILAFRPSVDAFYKFRQAIRQFSSVPGDKNTLIDHGFKALALIKMSRHGAGQNVQGGVRQEGKHTVSHRWHSGPLVRNLWRWHQKLTYFQPREGRCGCQDFTRLIEDESCRAVLYCDPPYFKPYRTYYRYPFKEKDHIRLATALKACSHKWVLSYDDVPEVRDLYSWAKIRQIKTAYTLNSELVEANELIITRN